MATTDNGTQQPAAPATIASIESLASITLTGEQITALRNHRRTETNYVMRALADYPDPAKRIWELGRGHIVMLEPAPGEQFQIVRKEGAIIYVRPWTGERLPATTKANAKDHLADGVVPVPTSAITHTRDIGRKAATKTTKTTTRRTKRA
jgi:hypothetical protein